jgi:hypothetical protein
VLPPLLLQEHLLRVVQHEVHVLVEPLAARGGCRVRAAPALWAKGERTMMRPSMRSSVFSYSHTWTRCLDCRKRKIKFCSKRQPAVRARKPRAAAGPRARTIGCVIMRCTLAVGGGGGAAMVAILCRKLRPGPDGGSGARRAGAARLVPAAAAVLRSWGVRAWCCPAVRSAVAAGRLC